MITDRNRYTTTDPYNDHHPLGGHPNLKPLEKMIIRHQLSFMKKNSLTDRDRAVRLLLSRIQDYYQVIGYVGPFMSRTSECAFCLCGWNVEKGFPPWRQSYTNVMYSFTKEPAKIFNSVRYSCFAMALHLAAWELSEEVPESLDELKKAAWLAHNVIRQFSQRPWVDIRGRLGSSGMRKNLAHVIGLLPELILTESAYWLGSYQHIRKAS